MDTHRQGWVSLLWYHCSFLLGPGVHKVLFVPSKSLFPQSCVSSGSSGGVNGNLLQEDLRHTHTQSPCPCGRPLPTRTSAEDAHSSVSVSEGSLGPGVYKVCLSPMSVSGGYGVSFLNTILPLLSSCWDFSFVLGSGISPQSLSSTAQPLLQRLPSCWGFSAPLPHRQFVSHT